MDPLQTTMATVGLNAVADDGFVLAGGYALRAHGFGDRDSDDIDLFTGPGSGVVELPVPIDWSPQHSYDLGDPDDRVALYTTVISEASTVDDLARFLNKDLLIELWPQLRLPRYCVRRWHTAFPQLAAIGAGGIWQ